MTKMQKLFNDIRDLRDSVHHDYVDLASVHLSPTERGGLHHEISLLIKELAELQVRLGISN
jgi:hypothetical protein